MGEGQKARRARGAETGGLRHALGLERNILVMSAGVFAFGAGEELWKSFLPKYLEALGATATVIGFYGTARDFLDAVYQYPGGYVSDRVGSRRALVLFGALAAVGYLIYAFSPTWHFIFAGLVFVMAWSSMASPAMFAMIAETLPRERRAMGFTVQSILKRVPIMLSPTIGGLLIERLGVVGGVRASLFIAAALALVAIVAQRRFYAIRMEANDPTRMNLLAQLATMDAALKRLLVSDIFIRICEGMVSVFVVLYVMNVAGATPFQYGLLVAVQMGTSILVYLPAARLADRYGRKPFVILTFLCFSLFPVAVVVSRGLATLVLAFIVGGLRELGEPARKAMIVDLADPARRGRTVGLYYLIRSISITPASLVGGILWKSDPAIPFVVACVIGLIGTAIFAATVRSEQAA